MIRPRMQVGPEGSRRGPRLVTALMGATSPPPKAQAHAHAHTNARPKGAAAWTACPLSEAHLVLRPASIGGALVVLRPVLVPVLGPVLVVPLVLVVTPGGHGACSVGSISLHKVG